MALSAKIELFIKFVYWVKHPNILWSKWSLYYACSNTTCQSFRKFSSV